ncbi:hypothetical protein [Saccharolobus islandicus]|uniref:hypothetical protein n=1 Tax=Saccharolobus islandicus TaxID=43080 RepID=UPI00036E19A4|nr:hypothetical protein [Sulfolobus islandicus]
MSSSEGGNILVELISTILEGESRERKIAQVAFYGSLSAILYHYIPLKLKTEYVLFILLILENIIYLYVKNFPIQVISRIPMLIIDNIIKNEDPKQLISSILLGERSLISDLISLLNLKELIELLRIIVPSILIIFIISTITIEIANLINLVNYNLSLVVFSLSFTVLLILDEDNVKQDDKTDKNFLLYTYLKRLNIPNHKKLSKFAKLLVFLTRFLPIPKVSLNSLDTIYGMYICNDYVISQLMLTILNLKPTNIKAIYKQYKEKKEYKDIKDIINNIPIELKCDYTTGLHEYVKILDKSSIEKLNLILDIYLLLKIQSKDEWAYIIFVPIKYPNNLKINPKKKNRNDDMIKVLLTFGIGSHDLISKLKIVLNLYAINEVSTDMLRNLLSLNEDNFRDAKEF